MPNVFLKPCVLKADNLRGVVEFALQIIGQYTRGDFYSKVGLHIRVRISLRE